MFNYRFTSWFLVLYTIHILPKNCNQGEQPAPDLNLYEILSCASSATNYTTSLDSRSTETAIKAAVSRATEFFNHNPNWGSAVRKATQTLSHPGKRTLYDQDLQATMTSDLKAEIYQALDNSDATQLLAALVALEKIPGGNELIMNLTEDAKGLDYDYLRRRLLTDTDRVIDHINHHIFGY